MMSTPSMQQTPTSCPAADFEYPSISNLNGGVASQNSIGSMRNNQGAATGPKMADLGSIFASTNSSQAAQRLAPPPQNAVGRGRGTRYEGQSHQSRAKPSS
ncbi:hypothetical protein L1987_64183 [Smallanthus sonchifolius]|uniref:Uncharacterized protein n=1 Tax=Smallanthus sonchifolius TaxID=185202 RepID=A0ACB9CFD2_9ASTR|nr:hypothetical protein L1987_64183 [Smallanthus sonchifolius]